MNLKKILNILSWIMGGFVILLAIYGLVTSLM